MLQNLLFTISERTHGAACSGASPQMDENELKYDGNPARLARARCTADGQSHVAHMPPTINIGCGARGVCITSERRQQLLITYACWWTRYRRQRAQQEFADLRYNLPTNKLMVIHASYLPVPLHTTCNFTFLFDVVAFLTFSRWSVLC